MHDHGIGAGSPGQCALLTSRREETKQGVCRVWPLASAWHPTSTTRRVIHLPSPPPPQPPNLSARALSAVRTASVMTAHNLGCAKIRFLLLMRVRCGCQGHADPCMPMWRACGLREHARVHTSTVSLHVALACLAYIIGCTGMAKVKRQQTKPETPHTWKSGTHGTSPG